MRTPAFSQTIHWDEHANTSIWADGICRASLRSAQPTELFQFDSQKMDISKGIISVAIAVGMIASSEAADQSSAPSQKTDFMKPRQSHELIPSPAKWIWDHLEQLLPERIRTLPPEQIVRHMGSEQVEVRTKMEDPNLQDEILYSGKIKNLETISVFVFDSTRGRQVNIDWTSERISEANCLDAQTVGASLTSMGWDYLGSLPNRIGEIRMYAHSMAARKKGLRAPTPPEATLLMGTLPGSGATSCLSQLLVRTIKLDGLG